MAKGKKSDPTGSRSRARRSNKQKGKAVSVPEPSTFKHSKRDSSKEPNWK